MKISKFSDISQLLLFVTTSIFFTGCCAVSEIGSVQVADLVKYSLHYNFHDEKEDGTIGFIKTDVDVISNGEYFLYQIPYMYVLGEDGVVILEEERFQAFVVKSGEQRGYLFKTDNDLVNVVSIAKDSILRSKGITGLDFYSPDYLAYDKTEDSADSRVQKYYFTLEDEAMHYDSIYAYYNKGALGIPYSYSPSLDTSEVSKLYKVIIVGLPFFSKEKQRQVPRREVQFEMIREKSILESDVDYFNSHVDVIK